MLSRLILGVRISLLVGLIAVVISLTIGILLGAFAGYFGGKVDDFIMLIINTVWSIPTLLLVFAIVLALGKGIGIIFLAVGLTMWVEVARIVRGQVMSLKEIQFIEAAQSMGFSHWRIIGKHILPNILGPVMVVAAANFATKNSPLVSFIERFITPFLSSNILRLQSLLQIHFESSSVSSLTIPSKTRSPISIFDFIFPSIVTEAFVTL